MDGAALINAGGGHGHALLAYVVPGQRNVAFGRENQTAVGDRAGATVEGAGGGLTARHFVAVGGGGQVLLGATAFTNIKILTGGQRGLALLGHDLALVVHVPAGEQRVAAALGGGPGRGGGQPGAGLHVDVALGVGEHRLAAFVVTVQAALAELFVADVRRRRHQIAHVDLAGAAEHHPVAVHQHHRAVAFDLALDLAGPGVGIVDPVQHRPVGLLVKIHGGVTANVKGLPVKDRFVAGLLDINRGVAVADRLGRVFGIEPAGGVRVRVYL